MSSFPQYDVEYGTKLLAIFEKEGIISRTSKGVYVKARKTRFDSIPLPLLLAPVWMRNIIKRNIKE